MNALRLREGVPENLFAERTCQGLSTIQRGLAEARQRRMMLPGRLCATELGWRFLNDLVAIFEPA
jgi:oxygen-independent coproporphyrinogen-3 oxidase